MAGGTQNTSPIVDLDPDLILRVNWNKISFHSNRQMFDDWCLRHEKLNLTVDLYDGVLPETHSRERQLTKHTGVILRRREQYGDSIYSLQNGELHNPYSFAIWHQTSCLEYFLFGHSIYFANFVLFHKEYIKCKTIDERDNFCGYWTATHEVNEYDKWIKKR